MSEQQQFPGLPIHHASLPYNGPSSSKLETLDVWLPRPLEESDPERTMWIVYIHGGAWRDPIQDSTCIHPTLAHLSKSTPGFFPNTTSDPLFHIAGIASLNYRLSPYPTHPTHPSAPSDPSRNVTHPTHIQDVSTALNYLGMQYGVGAQKGRSYRWLGVGHSCGATLLAQYVSRIGLDTSDIAETEAVRPTLRDPAGLILISGIYSLPTFLSSHRPPTCPAHVAAIYRAIVTGAFGPDERAWTAASPVAGISRWEPQGKTWVVLAYSPEDELVEMRQREVMRDECLLSGWTIWDGVDDDCIGDGPKGKKEGGVVQIVDLKGAHDWVWEDGRQIAEMIGEMVRDRL